MDASLILSLMLVASGALALLPGESRGAGWVSAFACMLFVTGLWLPLMKVEKWHFWDNQYSVLVGAWRLALEGEGLLATMVLLFVVALPAARFVGLAWLGWGPSSERVARVVLLLDKWAMLDVFGLALLIVIVKIADIASVEPMPGFWVLLVATLLSLVDTWRLQRGTHR